MAVRDTRRGTSSCSVLPCFGSGSRHWGLGSRHWGLGSRHWARLTAYCPMPTAHSPLATSPFATPSLPQLPIISKIRQDRVGTGRLEHREQPPKEDVDQAVCVPDIEVDGIERLSEMPFRVVVQRAAVEALVTVRDRPFDDVVEDAIIQIELEGDGVVKPDVFVANVFP